MLCVFRFYFQLFYLQLPDMTTALLSLPSYNIDSVKNVIDVYHEQVILSNVLAGLV